MTGLGGDFTRRLLVDAGIGAGRRVLDIGCGSGDVSLLACELVGGRGAVVGIDRDAASLVAARDRARNSGFANLIFLQGEIEALPADLGTFDAIVGRRVLMYQPDAVRAVRHLAQQVRAGGLVVFQEHDSTMTPASLVPMPLHERAQQWIWQTVEREGGVIHMGFRLQKAFTEAGLSLEDVRAEAIVQTPTTPYALAAIVLFQPMGKGSDQQIATETRSRSGAMQFAPSHPQILRRPIDQFGNLTFDLDNVWTARPVFPVTAATTNG